MKKMIVALVAMVVMTMSAQAQVNNGSDSSFERLSNYLELRIDQVEPVKKATAQFGESLQSFSQLKDQTKGAEAWQKVYAKHLKKMKGILTQQQFEKYKQMVDQTAKNTGERVMEQLGAE